MQMRQDGNSVAISAFSQQSAPAVMAAIKEYAIGRGVDARPVAIDQVVAADAEVATISESGRWTVVKWPAGFYRHDIPVCIELARLLSAVVSTLHVYAGNYWTHALIDRGTALDLFCSVPDYFAETPDVKQRLREKWAGRPAIVAAALGAKPEQVAPYFVRSGDGAGKAFADDQYPLGDWRVYQDFLARTNVWSEKVAASDVRRLSLPRFEQRFPLAEGFEV